jgi:hypothetical protein
VRVRLKPGVSTSALVEKIRTGGARPGAILAEAQATEPAGHELVSATPASGRKPAGRGSPKR